MNHKHESCHCHGHHEHHHDHGSPCTCHHEYHGAHHHDAHCDCGHDHHHEHHHDEGGGCACCEAKLHGENTLQKGVLVRLCISALLFAVLLLLRIETPWLAFLLYLLPYLLIGYDVLLDAVRNILRGKVFDEQLLMALATIGAFAIGEFPEGVAVMLFYQLGELLQTLAVGKTRRSIAALMDIRPESACAVREGKEVQLAPAEVAIGEEIVVRPGERIPLDGTVLRGESEIDNAALTGESVPQPCEGGMRVLSGGINLSGVLYIRVDRAYEDSTVSKILELVEHAGEKKARVENFITRFSRYYTPFVVICAVLLALIPPLFFSQSLAHWVQRALVFLVVSCPCALVISVPLSFFGGIGAASRRGILIKGAGYLEQLSRVDTVAFDKTGTLTCGCFTVAGVCSLTLSEEQLLCIAASLEQYSNHPIAQALLEKNKRPLCSVAELREVAGKGICAKLEGEQYLIGHAAWMQENGIAVPRSDVGTAVFVAKQGKYLGHIVLRDEIKPNAKESLRALRATGVSKTVMLTGDRLAVAEDVAHTLGIDEVHAELLPAEKVEHVEHLLAHDGCVAFVGDGINDAPVLARADVGVAMGGIGTDAAIESSDVVLMEDDLGKLALAKRIARKTMRIVRQNITFALGAKGVILVLGALGIANMWLAVFGDVGVMLLAILNSMRAMRVKD